MLRPPSLISSIIALATLTMLATADARPPNQSFTRDGGLIYPSAVPPGVRDRAFRNRAQHPISFKSRQPADPGLRPDVTLTGWMTDNGGFIWRLNVAGVPTPTGQTPIMSCAGAQGAKVDRFRNLWTACTNTGTINMYKNPVTLASAPNTILVDQFAGVTYSVIDVAVDFAGDVFATSTCGASCTAGGNISFWKKSQVNSCFSSGNNPAFCGPTGVITDPNISRAYFLDSDRMGNNLYVDYIDIGGSAALDMIGSPIGTPTFTNLIPANPIPFTFPGGVYVTHNTPGGRHLTVVDQITQKVYQFHQPPTFAFPGPYWTTVAGAPGCNPVSGGYGMFGRHLGLGDATCFAGDIGFNMNTGSPSWIGPAFSTYTMPIALVFAPSDKY